MSLAAAQALVADAFPEGVTTRFKPIGDAGQLRWVCIVSHLLGTFTSEPYQGKKKAQLEALEALLAAREHSTARSACGVHPQLRLYGALTQDEWAHLKPVLLEDIGTDECQRLAGWDDGLYSACIKVLVPVVRQAGAEHLPLLRSDSSFVNVPREPEREPLSDIEEVPALAV